MPVCQQGDLDKEIDQLNFERVDGVLFIDLGYLSIASDWGASQASLAALVTAIDLLLPLPLPVWGLLPERWTLLNWRDRPQMSANARPADV